MVEAGWSSSSSGIKEFTGALRTVSTALKPIGWCTREMSIFIISIQHCVPYVYAASLPDHFCVVTFHHEISLVATSATSTGFSTMGK